MGGRTNQEAFTSREYRLKCEEFAARHGFGDEVLRLFEWTAMMITYEHGVPRDAAEESAYAIVQFVFTVNADEPS